MERDSLELWDERPPSDITTERCLLQQIIICWSEEPNVALAFDTLDPSDFYGFYESRLYAPLKDAWRLKVKRWTVKGLVGYLVRKKALLPLGTRYPGNRQESLHIADFYEILCSDGMRWNIPYYVRVVKNLSLRRQRLDAAWRLVQCAMYRPEEWADEVSNLSVMESELCVTPPRSS